MKTQSNPHTTTTEPARIHPAIVAVMKVAGIDPVSVMADPTELEGVPVQRARARRRGPKLSGLRARPARSRRSMKPKRPKRTLFGSF